MLDSYRTIVGRVRTEIKVQRSRFIATALPVNSSDEAAREYRLVQQLYHDATHNCLAWRLGVEPDIRFRYSDDGEPNGTAGKPIYDSIVAHDLTDILLVVTRYFGGVKLGTGGLFRAYRDAARSALSEAETVTKLLMQRVTVRFDHNLTSVVMKIISEFSLRPEETNYSDDVEIVTSVRLSRLISFKQALVDRTQGRVVVEEI